MALNVGELYAELTMETGAFDSAVGGLSGKLKGVGGLITGALGGAAVAAVGALGGAIVGGVMSVDSYRKALNGLGAETGATSAEMAEMGTSMKNLYANNMGESFEDIAQSMGAVKKATGLVGQELENATNNALLMRDTFGYEVNESIAVAEQMMKQFGVSSDEAYTLMAQGAQQGLDKNGDMLDTINEYSVYFDEMGFSAEEMFNVLASGAESGAFNLDKVGDAMKEFGIRSKDGSKASTEAFQVLGLNADEMMNKFAAGGDKAQEAFATTIDALEKIKDPTDRNTAALGLFGTQFEDLEIDAILALGNVEGSISKTADTLNQINNVKYNSFGEAMAGIGRQIQVGLIMPIGEKLLPHLNNFANWIAEKMPAITAYFSGLSDKVTAMAAVFAPAFETAKAAFQGLGDKVTELMTKFGPTFEQIGAQASGFGSTFTTIFQTIWGVVGPIMDLVATKVMEVVSLILSWWQSNGQALLQNVMIVFQGIWSVIQFIMPAVLAIIKMVFENIKGVISGALNIISGVFAIFAGLFTGNWSKMWAGVKQLVSGALQFIWNLWQLMLYGKLIAGIRLLGTKSLGLFKSMWGAIKNGFASFTNAITAFVIRMVTGVVSKFTNLVSRGVAIFNQLRTFGASIFNALSQAVINIAGRILSGVMGKLNSMKSQATNAFNAIKSAASRIFNAVKTAITKPIESAKTTVLGIIDKIKSAFNNLKIKIPMPKLPKVSISTKKNALFGIDVPSFNVDWFKTGGIATGPAIAGIGEAGSEAIVPLSGRRMKPFSDAIGQQVAQALGGVNTGDGQPIVVAIDIDGREFARATAKHYRAEEERTTRQSSRARGYNVE